MHYYLLSYPCGIICIVIGLLKLKSQYKKKPEFEYDGTPLQPYMDGWALGIGMILLGSLIIICKIQGKY